MTAAGPGSFAGGYAKLGGGVATIAAAKGSFAHGYVTGSSSAVIANAAGSHAFGHADATSRVGTGSALAGKGPSARGFGTGGGVVYARGHGSFSSGASLSGGKVWSDGAGGHALGHTSVSGKIYANATGLGGLASGYATEYAEIRAVGKGSVAIGYTKFGDILSGAATAHGTFAGGRVNNNVRVITANSAYAHGAFAWGDANTGAIIASASNAVQFGVGTNAQADSLSVGVGPRLKGTNGAPGTPRNGDFWVDTGVTKIRSNGISIVLDQQADAGLTQYGGISVNGGVAATTINTQNVWEQFLGFTTNDSSQGATPDHTNDHITVGQTGIYLINIAASFSGGINATYEVEVKKNNGTVDITNVHIERKLSAGGDIGSASPSGIVSLTAADTIELWVRNTTNTDDVTIKDASMTIVRIDHGDGFRTALQATNLMA